MRILKIDRKNNCFSVIPESLDDLWHLERVVQPGDLVSGKSERKIKPKEEGSKVRKENIFVQIKVEKAEFHEATSMLRIAGIIVAGKPEEFVELKTHHSLEVSPGRKIEVKKEKLKNYEVERLEKAKKASFREKLIAVILDDEQAELALIKDFGFEHKGKIHAMKAGKRYKEGEKNNRYFDEIMKKVREIGAEKVIFAGPGFTKNNLQKYLENSGEKANIFFESTNSVGITGLNELIRSSKLEKIAKELQLSKEIVLVERVFEEIGKDSGLGCYGIEEINKAIEAGAVEELIVSEKLLFDKRAEIEEIMEKAEQMQGKVHVVGAKHEAGKKLIGIGGIAALLRYKLY